MQAKTLFMSGIIAISAHAAYGTGVRTEFTAANGNWNNAGNWNNGVPGANDVAVIKANKIATFNVSSSVIGQLEVEASGELRIDTGNVLSVDGVPGTQGNDGLNVLNGKIVLVGSASTIEFTDMNQSLEGSGYIKGEHNASMLQIGDGVILTLTDTTRLEGALVVQAQSSDPDSATLTIEQTNASARVGIRADRADGVLKLDVSITLAETPYFDGVDHYASFEAVNASGAQLRFDNAAPSLGGDFKIDGNMNCCSMLFNASVATTGTLTFTKGSLIIGSSPVTFDPGNTSPYTFSGGPTYYAGGC